jgi:hypothetical protein
MASGRHRGPSVTPSLATPSNSSGGRAGGAPPLAPNTLASPPLEPRDPFHSAEGRRAAEPGEGGSCPSDVILHWESLNRPNDMTSPPASVTEKLSQLQLTTPPTEPSTVVTLPKNLEALGRTEATNKSPLMQPDANPEVQRLLDIGRSR